jgi:hypothetical protein
MAPYQVTVYARKKADVNKKGPAQRISVNRALSSPSGVRARGGRFRGYKFSRRLLCGWFRSDESRNDGFSVNG